MADNAKKISELVIATTLASTDRVVVLTSPASSANVKTITTANFANSVAAKFITNAYPVSNTSVGVAGQIAYDSNTIYICVANNKWGKAALTLAW